MGEGERERRGERERERKQEAGKVKKKVLKLGVLFHLLREKSGENERNQVKTGKIR